MKPQMRPLDSSHVLALAERGRSKSPPERALLMLSAVCPNRSWESLVNLSIGERDDLLLTLRQRTFGNKLPGVVSCPSCGLTLSINVDIDSLRSGSEGRRPSGTGVTDVAGFHVQFRLPNTGDLLAVRKILEPERQWLLLFERCVLVATRDSQAVPAADLPREIADEIARLIDEADPQSDLRLAMECPACGKVWRQTLDIAAFLWDELAGLARELLFEVHTLALAYGWSETRILHLSPWRRAQYLAMVNA